METFYVGCHQPSDCKHFPASFVSINRIRDRKSPFAVAGWVMDSGAFSELSEYGCYRTTVDQYAEEASRWVGNGDLHAVVSQDYMCEPWIIALTGLDVSTHQALTIERYVALRDANVGAYILPVLQGFTPESYVAHIGQYGPLLPIGAWVGVGSVCKRQGDPLKIVGVLSAIKAARPDLRLHGFGVKVTALRHATVRALLHSADSMAWSYAARKQGRNQNDWREAEAFRRTIESSCVQPFALQMEMQWPQEITTNERQ